MNNEDNAAAFRAGALLSACSVLCDSSVMRWIRLTRSQILVSLLLFVLFSQQVMSDSWQPHELQHSRLPCPSLSQSLLKLMSLYSVMPSSHLLFCHLLLLPSIFPRIRVFPMSQFFASGGQSIGVSASASVFPTNITN